MFHAVDGDTGRSMEAILKDENIERVFIMGLATDMVVKNTLWDILEMQNNTDAQAVLVAAGVRGVFDEPGDYYLSSPKSGSGVVKAEAIARGASIVASTDIDDALGELCAGTCDVDSDCDNETFCDELGKALWTLQASAQEKWRRHSGNNDCFAGRVYRVSQGYYRIV